LIHQACGAPKWFLKKAALSQASQTTENQELRLSDFIRFPDSIK
jgi:hypothetical protein